MAVNEDQVDVASSVENASALDLKAPSDVGKREGGPVFPNRRSLSATARQILEVPLEEQRITAYDETWFAGRPVV